MNFINCFSLMWNDFFLHFLIWVVQMTEKSVLCTSLLLNILNSSVKMEWMGTFANWVIQMNSVFKVNYHCAEMISTSASSGLSSSIFYSPRTLEDFLISFFFFFPQPNYLTCAYGLIRAKRSKPAPKLQVLQFRISHQWLFPSHFLYGQVIDSSSPSSLDPSKGRTAQFSPKKGAWGTGQPQVPAGHQSLLMKHTHGWIILVPPCRLYPAKGEHW